MYCPASFFSKNALPGLDEGQAVRDVLLEIGTQHRRGRAGAVRLVGLDGRESGVVLATRS